MKFLEFAKKSNKAQAGGIFQLLIAAIVAAAILGILFTILSQVGGIGGREPVEIITEKLRTAYQQFGVVYTTQQIQLKRGEAPITARGLVKAADIGITEEEMCFGVVDRLQDRVNVEEGKITANAATVNVRFAVICDSAADIQETVSDYYENVNLECGANVDNEDYPEACAVIVINPR